MKRVIAFGLVVNAVLLAGMAIESFQTLVAADCNGNGIDDAADLLPGDIRDPTADDLRCASATRGCPF